MLTCSRKAQELDEGWQCARRQSWTRGPSKMQMLGRYLESISLHPASATTLLHVRIEQAPGALRAPHCSLSLVQKSWNEIVKGCLSLGLPLQIFRQILSGLVHIHAQGIIHSRPISPLCLQLISRTRAVRGLPIPAAAHMRPCFAI